MSDIYVGQLVSSNTLEHHGILGMKWGVRRYQNEDGTLTESGKKRLAKQREKSVKRAASDAYFASRSYNRDRKKVNKIFDKRDKTSAEEIERFDRKYTKKLEKYNKRAFENEKILQKSLETVREETKNLGKDKIDSLLSSAAVRDATVGYYNGYIYYEYVDHDRLRDNLFVNQYLRDKMKKKR